MTCTHHECTNKSKLIECWNANKSADTNTQLSLTCINSPTGQRSTQTVWEHTTVSVCECVRSKHVSWSNYKVITDVHFRLTLGLVETRWAPSVCVCVADSEWMYIWVWKCERWCFLNREQVLEKNTIAFIIFFPFVPSLTLQHSLFTCVCLYFVILKGMHLHPTYAIDWIWISYLLCLCSCACVYIC